MVYTTQSCESATDDKSELPFVVCYCCGGIGHIKKNCWYKDERCYYCHIKGHFSRVCRYRLANCQQKTPSNAEESEESEDSGEYVTESNSSEYTSKSSQYYASSSDVSDSVHNVKFTRSEQSSGERFQNLSRKRCILGKQKSPIDLQTTHRHDEETPYMDTASISEKKSSIKKLKEENEYIAQEDEEYLKCVLLHVYTKEDLEADSRSGDGVMHTLIINGKEEVLAKFSSGARACMMSTALIKKLKLKIDNVKSRVSIVAYLKGSAAVFLTEEITIKHPITNNVICTKCVVVEHETDMLLIGYGAMQKLGYYLALIDETADLKKQEILTMVNNSDLRSFKKQNELKEILLKYSCLFA